jgi:hypothetical protein
MSVTKCFITRKNSGPLYDPTPKDRIGGTIQCQDGSPVISLRITGSNFPTRYAFVNDVPQYPPFLQEQLNSLWNCSRTTPVEIL